MLPCTEYVLDVDWCRAAFLIQATTHGGIQAEAPGLSKLSVASSMTTASNWKYCRSSHVSTTWWQPILSPGLKTHASVRRSRFPVLSQCWPKSYILTDNYMTSEFLRCLFFFLSFYFFSFNYVINTHFQITVKAGKWQVINWLNTRRDVTTWSQYSQYEPDTARISAICVENQFLSDFIPDSSQEWLFSGTACKYWLFIFSVNSMQHWYHCSLFTASVKFSMLEFMAF